MLPIRLCVAPLQLRAGWHRDREARFSSAGLRPCAVEDPDVLRYRRPEQPVSDRVRPLEGPVSNGGGRGLLPPSSGSPAGQQVHPQRGRRYAPRSRITGVLSLISVGGFREEESIDIYGERRTRIAMLSFVRSSCVSRLAVPFPRRFLLIGAPPSPSRA